MAVMRLGEITADVAPRVEVIIVVVMRMKTMKRLNSKGRLVLHSEEEFKSMYNVIWMLAGLDIKGGEELHTLFYRRYSGDWEQCEYCECPNCECTCDDEPRYMREYDDGASMDD